MQASAASTAAAPEQSLDTRKTVPWIIYLIFFGVLNETVFNVSTPEIAKQYAISSTGVGWVLTTFIIFFGIGSVIYGKLSDLFSLKKLIVTGIVIYNAGSLIGFALQMWYPTVIVGRAVQGAGASAIPALIMVVVARYFSPADRGKVFGLLTSTIAFAVGVGPVLGGFISQTFHWTYLFLIPLFTLISIPFFRQILPDDPGKAGKIDLPGAVMLALGVAGVVLFLSFPTWYYATVGLGMLALFVWRIRRVSDPFIEPRLFANRLLRSGLVIGFILFCAVMGIMFAVPLMLSGVNGLATGQIGLVLFPGAISAVVFGTIGGNLADRKGNNFVVYVGLALLTVSLVTMAMLLGRSQWWIAAAMLPTYVGFSFIQTALANRVSLTLEIHETGVGMGLFNLISFISGAVGTALVAKLLDSGALVFAFNPLVPAGAAIPYSNMLLVFALGVVVSGGLYYRSFGGVKRAR
ncbi:MFS transporter [Paenibacillus athensensis]|uniref:Tetracycline resistance protein n=1 Tax=Paenibacillus athensensis TaxID=1967502 RepID=A0A4Y8Q3P6_9BACL|nr:MFS transporter [Paenibacillus athensensis]MCD1260651.1 MFS transporter [Paenibacillus athensensis]